MAQQSALLRLLYDYSYKRITELPEPDLGFAEPQPFPFLAIVGQYQMKLALLLATINPGIGGVLLIGPRGTGKTTAVRSLLTILPFVEVSDCADGALPHELEKLNREEAQALFPDCYEKWAAGQAISHYESVKLVELPLSARVEDVVGGINERIAVARNEIRVERGILSRADNNILYIDEINLLDDEIVDLILDAAAQGSYTVRRGAVVGTYRSRFVLIGSMNPEEGRLRPQILDRLGMRVLVTGIVSPEERAEVYRRASAYRANPKRFASQYELMTANAQEEIAIARNLLKSTTLSDEIIQKGIEIVRALNIDSHRAEYAMFEAARAYCAADMRTEVTLDDLRAVAPLTLRQRKSEFMTSFIEAQRVEDRQIEQVLEKLICS
jgi:magnesium chelatase subunit I